MAGFSVFSVTFTGLDLRGLPAQSISVPGVKAGDTRIALWQNQLPAYAGYITSTIFSYVIATDDEIDQSAGADGAVDYTAIFIRFS